MSKVHAATTAGTNSYCYDQNGNMVRRSIGSNVYDLGYDAENHLTSVSGAISASFVFDGDGNRVKGTVGSATMVYIGNYFEWTGSIDTKKSYYYAGSIRVAINVGGSDSQSPTLYWLFGDHLGSTSRTINANGTPLANGELRYKPWGEKRFPSDLSAIPTTFRFTGQRQEALLGGSDGLYYFGARWLDPYLGRFIQADMIIMNPQNPQSLDRFLYANDNPLKYIDPTGNTSACGYSYSDPECPSSDDGDVVAVPKKPSRGLTRWGNNMWMLYVAWSKVHPNVTLIDFLKLTLSFKFAPLENYQGDQPSDKQRLIGLLGHTATHWIYWYCGYQAGCTSDTGLSDASILNFIGISGSMRMRFDQFNATKAVNFGQESAPDIAEAVVNLMLNPEPEWKTGGYDSNGHPSTWGNAQIGWWRDPFKVNLVLSSSASGFDVNISGHPITFKYSNFVILSADEVKYWKSPP